MWLLISKRKVPRQKNDFGKLACGLILVVLSLLTCYLLRLGFSYYLFMHICMLINSHVIDQAKI